MRITEPYICVILNTQNIRKMKSVVIFDGTSYFVEQAEYTLGEDEEIIFRGTFEECVEECDELNDLL